MKFAKLLLSSAGCANTTHVLLRVHERNCLILASLFKSLFCSQEDQNTLGTSLISSVIIVISRCNFAKFLDVEGLFRRWWFLALIFSSNSGMADFTTPKSRPRVASKQKKNNDQNRQSFSKRRFMRSNRCDECILTMQSEEREIGRRKKTILEPLRHSF